MPEEKAVSLDTLRLREKALARWENEGGAVVCGSQGSTHADDAPSDVPALTNAELSQLHIRVIALEGLVTVLLAQASERQLELVREMAIYISPRPGFTHHPLTMRAANQMIDLSERAERFRTANP